MSDTIGSDTAVVRFTEQLELGNDEVAAFAGIDGGFRLVSPSVQTLVRTVFPAQGDFEINGATLVLGRDLITQEVSAIKSLGNIYGNGYLLDLAATISCIPSGTPSVGCFIRFITSSLQDNEVLSVDWSFDDGIIAVGLDASGGSHDTFLTYLFDGSTLTLADSDLPGSFTDVNAVRWHPTLRLLAIGKNGGGTNELFTYSVTSGGILTQVDFDNVGTIEAVAWHTTGDYLATGGNANAAEVRLYPVDTSGNLDIANRLDLNITPNINVQKEALDWDITGSYLAVGFNNAGAANNLRVFEFNDQPSLSLVQNAGVTITGDDVETVSWHPVISTILAIGTDETTDSVRIYSHDPGGGTLTQEFALSLPEQVRTVHWNPDGTCLAVGTDDGVGSELIIYSFDSSTFVLTQEQGFEFSDDVQSVRWSNDGKNIALGNDDDTLYIYEVPTADDSCVTFSDLNIGLQCNVELKNCCILFSGDNVIRGRGKNLTLQPTCTLIIDMESTLFLKDITVKGIQDSNIQFFDNSSTLSLQDVTWVLDDDFTVTLGHFDVLKDFTVTGDGKKFTYQTEVQSTIQECGKMILDDGVTFSYDPVTGAHDLLLLTSETSELVLNGATLYSTPTGLQLTTGMLTVEQLSFICGDGEVESEAVRLGTGIQSTSNIHLNILPAAWLEVSKGCLAYSEA